MIPFICRIIRINLKRPEHKIMPAGKNKIYHFVSIPPLFTKNAHYIRIFTKKRQTSREIKFTFEFV